MGIGDEGSMSIHSKVAELDLRLIKFLFQWEIG